LHTVQLRVRTYECDAYGHVNNAVYLNYLEYARDLWLHDHGLDYQALVASGFGIFVAEARLVYQSPALPGEDLAITTETEESGAAWVSLRQTITGPGARAVLEGHMKLVWVGPQGRPTRIPADWKAKFLTRA
jgi:YbgC/YbaW family acyl-CoA thioester hydrolase